MKPFIRTGLIWSAIAFILSGGIALYTWNALPSTGDIPVHWGLNGQPDQFAPKAEAWPYIALMPGVVLLIGLLLAVVPMLDPRKGNIETGRKAYLATWIGTLILMTLIHGGICAAMLQASGEASLPNDAVRYVIAGCAALMIVIGNYLPKTRSSFMFGVRTPWTLSSDIAWEKTHRVAGPLFMLAGALGMAGAFLFNGIWLALQLTALVGAAAIVSVVYSYFAWKNAGDRDDGTGLTV
ncbi:MAG: SdpI family protein [Hyphomonas sp.]